VTVCSRGVPGASELSTAVGARCNRPGFAACVVFYMIETIMALTVALVISFVMSLISVFTRSTTLGMVSTMLMWVFSTMIVMQIAGFVAEATGMPSAGHLALVLFIFIIIVSVVIAL